MIVCLHVLFSFIYAGNDTIKHYSRALNKEMLRNKNTYSRPLTQKDRISYLREKPLLSYSVDLGLIKFFKKALKPIF